MSDLNIYVLIMVLFLIIDALSYIDAALFRRRHEYRLIQETDPTIFCMAELEGMYERYRRHWWLPKRYYLPAYEIHTRGGNVYYTYEEHYKRFKEGDRYVALEDDCINSRPYTYSKWSEKALEWL